MYTLFNNEPVSRASNFTFPLFSYVKDALNKDVDRWVAYQRNGAAHCRSNHLLVKLLESINVFFDGNLIEYRSSVEQRVASFTGQFHMTSALQKGKPFTPGVFYGEEVFEIILADDSDFDISHALEVWKSWQPVRVLAHHRSDLGIEALDGLSKSEERGHAVISVNVPMLACQYQLWRVEQKLINAQSVKNVENFIMQYPLTNAIYSHLDVAIFNRYVRRSMGEHCGKSHRQYPFMRIRIEDKLDAVIQTALSRFKTNRMPMVDIMRNIPAFSKTDMLEVHRLPEMPHTNQVLWALVAARLNMTAFLLHLRDVTDNERSLDEMNAIKRALIQLDSNKALSGNLPGFVSDYFTEFVDNFIRPYLRA